VRPCLEVYVGTAVERNADDRTDCMLPDTHDQESQVTAQQVEIEVLQVRSQERNTAR
jgi:hypothetical protein